ncbi:MAG: hypothetical protein VYB65_06850 [Myxococcota bacterium]|nr:hypothetical protein [Myxococcota bacterium]
MRDKMIRCLTLSFAVAFGFMSSDAAAQSQYKMSIRVIHATKDGTRVDPGVVDLKADLAQLAFTSFRLLDGHTKTVFDREVVALEFPGSRWLEVRTRGVAKDGSLKVSMKVRDLKFKAKAKVGAGSTVLLGGPPHQNGSIILAVTATQL